MGNHRKKFIDNGQTKWRGPLIFSLVFHLTAFSMFLFVPESMPIRRINGPTVYEVDLVQLPSEPEKKVAKAAVVTPGKIIPHSAKTSVSRRISQPKKKEKPVIIGKRVVERKTQEKKPVKKVEKPKVNASKLIDQAISKIERKVKAEKKVKVMKKDHLTTALSKIQSQVAESGKENPTAEPSESGIALRLYQMEVAERIKQNWSYPVAISNPGELQGIEAVVVVTVRENGVIVRSSVKKRSLNTLFDASVLKAIERSDPLPPFPDGYRKSSDDIEIRFNLSEMENS